MAELRAQMSISSLSRLAGMRRARGAVQGGGGGKRQVKLSGQLVCAHTGAIETATLS